jgi:3-hydroxyacyl-[acyl-carrier-protein] dehydratase
MLLGNFFTIQFIQASPNAINARLEINPSHPIFQGHFPGIPVVPGVCMIQMLKEILESVIGQTTRLVKSDQIKFLSVLDPNLNKIIQAELTYGPGQGGIIQAAGSLSNNEMVFLKFKGIFFTGDFPGTESPEKSL